MIKAYIRKFVFIFSVCVNSNSICRILGGRNKMRTFCKSPGTHIFIQKCFFAQNPHFPCFSSSCIYVFHVFSIKEINVLCGLKEKKYNIYVKMEARTVRVVVSRSNTFNISTTKCVFYKNGFATMVCINFSLSGQVINEYDGKCKISI